MSVTRIALAMIETVATEPFPSLLATYRMCESYPQHKKDLVCLLRMEFLKVQSFWNM